MEKQQIHSLAKELYNTLKEVITMLSTGTLNFKVLNSLSASFRTISALSKQLDSVEELSEVLNFVYELHQAEREGKLNITADEMVAIASLLIKAVKRVQNPGFRFRRINNLIVNFKSKRPFKKKED